MRYIAKNANDLQPDEPCAAFMTTRDYMDETERHINSHPHEWEWLTWCPWSEVANRANHAIVDTHDAWHTARVEAPPLELTAEDVDAWKDRKAARIRFKAELVVPGPSKPTDAEIVEHMEARARLVDYGAPVMRDYLSIRGLEVAMAEVRAAWSRELKRKQAEAREVERNRIACEDQYEL
jgi:hypothetical protein